MEDGASNNTAGRLFLKYRRARDWIFERSCKFGVVVRRRSSPSPCSPRCRDALLRAPHRNGAPKLKTRFFQCGRAPAIWFWSASRFRSATSTLTESARMVASTATACCALIASTAAPNFRGLRFSLHHLGLRRRRLCGHRRQRRHRLQCRESSRIWRPLLLKVG